MKKMNQGLYLKIAGVFFIAIFSCVIVQAQVKMGYEVLEEVKSKG